jgi:hypothetical protein
MDKTQLFQDFGFFHTFFAEDFIGSSEGVKFHTCNLKMDKTPLPQDFGLFCNFFAEDYIGSSEGVKMLYMLPENGQNSTAPRFWAFLYFFR